MPSWAFVVGSILAAIFPTDRIDTAADLRSFTIVGTAHVVVALLAFVCVVCRRVRERRGGGSPRHRGLAEGARRCRRSGRRPRQGNAALPPRDRCGTQERARELSADAHCWSITAPTPRRINPEACEKELLPAFHSARMDPASLVDVAETPEGIGFAIGPPEAGRDARSRRRA
jgi:hypothetical protein